MKMLLTQIRVFLFLIKGKEEEEEEEEERLTTIRRSNDEIGGILVCFLKGED